MPRKIKIEFQKREWRITAHYRQKSNDYKGKTLKIFPKETADIKHQQYIHKLKIIMLQ